MTSQGMTGRHQPFAAGAEEAEAEAEEAADPRYAPAEDALMAGDLDTAIAEYQKLLDANPADAEAAVGLSRARLMQRTADVDPAAARGGGRRAARRRRGADPRGRPRPARRARRGRLRPADRPGAAYLGRRARPQARLHLLELFAVVGNEDPRVLAGRRDLASALF